MEQLPIYNKYYAVLIDADNVSTKYATSIIEEISKYGTPAVKRIYGDWSMPHLRKWRDMLPELALSPIQQFGHTKAKNATDIALIIDAMDLLYSKSIQGFCIVSSDSDYIKLATRLRESSMHVIGMGESKTPAPFISACNKFIYLENLIVEEEEEEIEKKIFSKKKIKSKGIDRKTKILIKKATQELSNEDGWAYLSTLGKMLNDSRPDFDPRTYGYNKLNELLKDLPKDFEIERDDDGKTYIVRVK